MRLCDSRSVFPLGRGDDALQRLGVDDDSRRCSIGIEGWK